MKGAISSFQESTMVVAQSPQLTPWVSVTTDFPSLPPPIIINNNNVAPTPATIPSALDDPIIACNIEEIKADHEYFNTLPPGYRFTPSDAELLVHYLRKKVDKQPLPRNKIIEVNLYDSNPEKIAGEFKEYAGSKEYGGSEWYFFTPRDRKYKHGRRPKRAAGDGYWKATGCDRAVKSNDDRIVGYKKSLVFYKGKAPQGDKTNWIMHEFRVTDPPKKRRSEDDMRLDDWVLCRVYKKTTSMKNRRTEEEKKENEIPPVPNHGDVDDALDGGFCNSGDRVSLNTRIVDENLQRQHSYLNDVTPYNHLPFDRFANQQPLDPNYASNEYLFPDTDFPHLDPLPELQMPMLEPPTWPYNSGHWNPK